MSAPTMLVVNPSTALMRGVQAYLRGASMPRTGLTTYCRPFDDAHPRMRPQDKTGFRLVVIDVSGWVSGRTEEDVLNGPPLPDWIRRDLLSAIDGALVIVLAPYTAFQAVNALTRRLPGEPQVVAVRKSRRPGDNAAISDVIRSEWDRWLAKQTAPRPFSRDRIRETADYFTLR